MTLGIKSLCHKSPGSWGAQCPAVSCAMLLLSFPVGIVESSWPGTSREPLYASPGPQGSFYAPVPVACAPVLISILSAQGCAPPAPKHPKSTLCQHHLSPGIAYFLPLSRYSRPLHVAWAADTDTSSFFYILNSVHRPCDGSLQSNQWSYLRILLL